MKKYLCAILRKHDLERERTKIPSQSLPMEKIPSVKLNPDSSSV